MLDRGSLLIFDSEAKEKNLPVNRKIENTYKIRGTFLITGNDELEQDFKDLSEEQIKEYKEEFKIEKELNKEIENGDDMEL
jgi:hypothetical protein|nr:MAG TPA: protein of unknown function (DUF3846) [Bacteriophage sp.]